jgi:hypothetical protein
MKYLMKHITTLVVAVLAGSLYSCNFLDVDDYFEQTLDYEAVFKSKRNVERYLWATANYFPDEGNLNHSPGPFATDEGLCITNDFRGSNYVLGEISPTNTMGIGNWGTMYVIVRKANTIIARIDEAPDLTTLDKREILGYAYFMRAYAYYHLLMKYGPVVILGDDVLDNNEEPEYYDRSRATFDESVAYVCDELKRAADYLPVEVSLTNFGRPTQGAALGLLARVKLIHASPLYNGQAAARMYFSNWKRSTYGVNYVSQVYDESRWAEAAFAAKRVIDLNRYSLYIVPRMPDTPALPDNVPDAPFPDGAGDIDPLRSYSDMFSGEALAVRNTEFVWGRMSAQTTGFTRFAFPILPMGGWNCLGVTQKVVDAYRMADGRTIEDSSAEYPYSQEGFLGGSGKTFSGYRLLSTASNMYVNREMRFYASIGFSECFWPANSTSENARKNQTVTYYNMDGTAGKSNTNDNPLNYPITGYVLKKFVHPDDAWEGTNSQRIEKPFPIIRYAEILLSYVEALNNLTTTHSLTDELSGEPVTFSRDVEEIRKYFNMVRFRAGLPGLTDQELASPETVQALIERERMVEFLFEDRRYFDVRRWGIYETTEREPIMGMNTDAQRNGYYSVVPVNHSKARNRVVDRKLVLFPLDLNEVRKAPSLDQNPGWQN